ETEIQAALGDPGLHGFGIGDHELRHDARMARLELAQDLGQQEFGEGRARADQQRPDLLAADPLQRGLELARKRKDAFSVIQRDHPGWSERDAAVGTVEQPRVEVLLELAYLEGDG